MWLFTVDGFFSVVQDSYCGPNELMVRARNRKDLEAISGKMGVECEIITTLQADYHWRMKVPSDAWVGYVTQAAKEITYPNFKAKCLGPAGCIGKMPTTSAGLPHEWQDVVEQS